MNLSKKLEHLLKNSVGAILRAALEQKPRSPNPPYQKILFLRFDALGDMILSFPVYRAARSALPDAHLDVLCSRKNVILLQEAGLVDDLLIAGKNPLELIKLIFDIRKRNYDLIINLVTRPSFTFGLVARLGGPKSIRIASEQEQFSYFYNRNLNLPPKADIHMMKRKFLVCQDIINTEISHTDTPWISYDENLKEKAGELFGGLISEWNLPAEKRRIAAVNLTAGLERREWPVDKYIDTLKIQIEKYQDWIDGWVVFTDPVKSEKTDIVVSEVNHPRIVALPAQSDFRVIMEFLSLMTVLITPDTSIAHAASAMGTPVLVLTIGENKTVWDPVGVTFEIVFSDDPFSLKTLPVEKVVKGFDQLMEQVGSSK
jgi:ADP-heptose:LPS heptosyltransferase